MARTLSLRYSGFKIHSSTTRTKHGNGDIALHLVRLLSMLRLLVISLWSFLLYSTRVLDVAGHANTLIKLGITISTMNHYGRSDSISLGYPRSMVEGCLEPSHSAHTKPWARTKIQNLVIVDVHLRLASLSALHIQSAHYLWYVQYCNFIPFGFLSGGLPRSL